MLYCIIYIYLQAELIRSHTFWFLNIYYSNLQINPREKQKGGMNYTKIYLKKNKTNFR